jgi:D-alanyl-D-alanine carboxypeptidase/D-alanyl-D-alanine-endopeptidase (penicillin-binding protein 4)
MLAHIKLRFVRAQALVLFGLAMDVLGVLGVMGVLATPPALAQGLPKEVLAALLRAQVPPEALSVWVMDVQKNPLASTPRLNHLSQEQRNPASVMKLVTTLAALELLGPTYTWNTPVYVQGRVRDGVLHGNLWIKGSGDPKLVMERVWLMLRRVQSLGITQIQGDIVLDRSAFEPSTSDPGEFDGERLRPYNATPEALLINYKSLVLTFTPDRAQGLARVHIDPPLANVQVPITVGLEPARSASAGLLSRAQAGTECDDYRAALKADFQAGLIRFAGRYPAGCGERVWSVAYPEPASFAARSIEGLWRSMGGQLSGSVRDGQVPTDLPATFESVSPPLAEVIRDINKFSNNVMAQQLFLTLSLNAAKPASMAGSREAIHSWWRKRIGDDAPLIDNGSGLSRQERISAQALGRLLHHGYKGATMPDWLASLPISGVDGTLKRMGVNPGAAHLKSGSLRDVVSVAGVVHGHSGTRYALAVIINHPNANAARSAVDALVTWTAKDQ